jgi:DNA-directed RNA polymerase specialized sigma24 family protein
MHAPGRDAEDHQLSDAIYLVLLRELASPDNLDLVQTLLLRIVIPALHKEMRTIRGSFPQLLPEDLAQQLVMTCMETLRSDSIRRKDAYLGISILEQTRRSTIRWAIHQYRAGAREETGILIDETVPANSPEKSVEVLLFLRHLLDKSLASGLLSLEEEKLLMAYKIEGFSGAELGRRAGLAPKAISHRVQRILKRLNRTFKSTNERNTS